jgi:hypothetical protein
LISEAGVGEPLVGQGFGFVSDLAKGKRHFCDVHHIKSFDVRDMCQPAPSTALFVLAYETR